MKRFDMLQRGFTLIELLVVIAIIGVLAGILFIAINPAEQNAKANDAIRISALNQVQRALELYQLDHGSYPLPARGSNRWTGHCPDYGNNDNYIAGLVPKYMPSLPIDPKFDTGSLCYLYKSNGADYMMITHNTMETIQGRDPSHSSNPENIRRMDRAAYPQPTIGIWSEGGKDW